jgi:hypothetical protein
VSRVEKIKKNDREELFLTLNFVLHTAQKTSFFAKDFAMYAPHFLVQKRLIYPLCPYMYIHTFPLSHQRCLNFIKI